MARIDTQGGFALRQIVLIVAIGLATMSVGVSVALVVLTTSLHHTSSVLRDNVRNARLGREAQVDLLLYERATDPAERKRLEDKLDKILAVDVGAPSTVNGEVRAEARRRIERFLASPDSPPAERAADLEAALDGVEPIVAAAVAKADDASARASSLDRIGDAIGALTIAMITLALVLMVLWMRRAVVRPMLELSSAMDRFGAGDLDVRAVPGGATELRRMVRQFNAMGETLARQHRQRLTHLAGVAHDLRNPLAALQMSAALVDLDRLSDPAVRRAIGLVKRQISRLNRMVDDLIDAAQIDAGHLTLEERETDLRQVVRDVAALFSGTSNAHVIRADIPEAPLMLRCDPLRIEQTLSNLVSNAIKYSPRGGTVVIRAYQELGAAKVSVSDEGVGIRDADLQHIWEPFRRTGVSAEAIPGVGLGLWTAKRIVQAHRGTILVESEVGEGSTFAISLPLGLGRSVLAGDAGSETVVPPLPMVEALSRPPRGSHG